MPADTADEILDAVKALAIAERSEEIEQARRVPPDLIDELTTAGCFRMLAPRSHGGPELDLASQMRVNEQLARADGSVGWTVMIGSVTPAVLGRLPRQTFDAVYADGPDVVFAGALNPTGVATPTDDGFTVNGQWAFASGCDHCHWFLAHAIVDDGRMPPVRMMLLPPSDVTIKDTWSVAGLCGTGSHDFAVEDAFVPAERSFALGGEPCLDTPLLQLPIKSLIALEAAAVAVGIAQGALDEITALATKKVPAFDKTSLAGSATFQHQLGEADASLRAARALLYADAEALWATAAGGGDLTNEQRARSRSTATWAVRAAASVVDTAYTAGGGSAIYSTSPLQRRLRDVHVLTQNAGIKLDTLTKVGAVLAGQEPDPAFF
jgi:alkylation response protein AidB-like acyl-CoA dehydrogenase